MTDRNSGQALPDHAAAGLPHAGDRTSAVGLLDTPAAEPEHWSSRAVFYHIYPLGLTGSPARNDFGAPPVDRLDQLTGWLGHIKSLGCNTLYVGPLFESTAHGYDTADYWHLDRRLGTDGTLRRLVDACHGAGLRVVLDGVFNHVGRDFWAFRDVLANGEGSAYRGWFAGLDFAGRSPYGDPFTYEAWSGCFDLVKLDLSNAGVREHLFGAVSSWIRDFDIDGLRLDAADVIDIGFQRDLAAMCRSLKSDFWLFGEVVAGDYRHWAGIGALDSVTNYEAYKGLWSSLVDRNYFEIAWSLNRQFGPDGLYRGMPLYNFADNHDSDRVASKLGDNRLLYPLYLLLFTMPGVPSIYYGSEWGMRAVRAKDDDSPLRPAIASPDGNGPPAEPALAGVIERFAAVRAGSAALRQGVYRQLSVASEQFAFGRTEGCEEVVVMLNSADKAVEMAVPAPRDGEWRDMLNGDTVTASDGTLRAKVYSDWGKVLRAE